MTSVGEVDVLTLGGAATALHAAAERASALAQKAGLGEEQHPVPADLAVAVASVERALSAAEEQAQLVVKAAEAAAEAARLREKQAEHEDHVQQLVDDWEVVVGEDERPEPEVARVASDLDDDDDEDDEEAAEETNDGAHDGDGDADVDEDGVIEDADDEQPVDVSIEEDEADGASSVVAMSELFDEDDGYDEDDGLPVFGAADDEPEEEDDEVAVATVEDSDADEDPEDDDEVLVDSIESADEEEEEQEEEEEDVTVASDSASASSADVSEAEDGDAAPLARVAEIATRVSEAKRRLTALQAAASTAPSTLEELLASCEGDAVAALLKAERREREVATVVESLMRALTELDSVLGGPAVRPARKAQVSAAQRLLDQADGLLPPARALVAAAKPAAEAHQAALKAKEEEAAAAAKAEEERARAEAEAAAEAAAAAAAKARAEAEVDWSKETLDVDFEFAEHPQAVVAGARIRGLRPEDVALESGEDGESLLVSGTVLPTAREAAAIRRHVESVRRSGRSQLSAKELTRRLGAGRFGTFEQRFSNLPEGTTPSDVDATVDRDGTLRLVFPRPQAQQRRARARAPAAAGAPPFGYGPGSYAPGYQHYERPAAPAWGGGWW